jgi:hypothetical protein
MLYGNGDLAMCKIFTMRKKGHYLFFEENEEKQRIYYSLVNRYGETLRRGDMSLSLINFIDLMKRIGFEEADLIA